MWGHSQFLIGALQSSQYQSILWRTSACILDNMQFPHQVQWYTTKLPCHSGYFVVSSQHQLLQTLEGPSGYIHSVAFSPDSARLASASYDQNIKVWDASSGESLQTLKGHTGSVNSVAFSADSARLASGSSDGAVKIWDAGSGECFQALTISRMLYCISLDISNLCLYTRIGTIDISALLGLVTLSTIL